MAAAIFALILALPQAAPDTVVVCPSGFREALEPWLAYRSRQGHSLVLLSNLQSAEQIRDQIREVSRQGRLRFVVLVGDGKAASAGDPTLRPQCVPVHYAKAQVNMLWGSEPYLPTDNWYADLDGDQVPDVAVGRLAVDTPEQLAAVVKKILAYERSSDFGPWRRQVNVVAGMGGFGPLVDTVLESAARYFITRDIPEEYQTSITYGSWRSPYCPDPRRFHATTLERLNEGALFWVYIGHGFPLGLDRVQVPGGDYHILATADMAKLQCRHAAPIAFFLSCYTGAFDASEDCLATQMLRAPGGPVAVLAGSRVTMPYAMAVMSSELMHECFQRRCPTLGEAILHAKRNMMQEARVNDPERAILDTVALAISPAPQQLAAERAEHVRLFNLIGDPLLRLRHPRKIDVVVTGGIAGKPLKVVGGSPVDGRCRVELVAPRGTLAFNPPARPQYPQRDDDLSQFQEVYDRANDSRLAAAETTVRDGRFEVQLDVPAAARGPCRLRTFVQGDADFATGTTEVEIAKQPD